jgi:hypothetical protein
MSSDSKPLSTGGLFSPNVTPAQLRFYMDGRFSTGAGADAASKNYAQKFSVAHTFVFRASESRIASGNRALQFSIAPALEYLAQQFRDDSCVVVTGITLRRASTKFWAPVALTVCLRSAGPDVPEETVRLGATVFVQQMEMCASAVVRGEMRDAVRLYGAEDAEPSLAWQTRTAGGVRGLAAAAYEPTTRRDRTCWKVPAHSALGITFRRAAEEQGGPESVKKWIEERVGAHDDAHFYIYDIKAEACRASMLRAETRGLFLDDVRSGVHALSVEARPLVYPVSGEPLDAEAVARANPLIEATLVVPANRAEEIMERWEGVYSLGVEVEFDLRVYVRSKK